MKRRDVLVLALSATAYPLISTAQQEVNEVFVQNGEVRIATQSFGNPADEPLVLVMGATASMLGWPEGLCTALADHGFYVIRFDHRDTGSSTTVPLGEATYSVEDMASDVLAIMDAYSLDSAHLAGMSLGGFISQMLALSNPERVRTITLIGSEPLGWDGAPLPHIAEAFLEHFATFEEIDWADKPTVASFLLEIDRLCAGSAYPYDEQAARERIEDILDQTDSPASMFNHSSRDTETNWTGRFREITLPVLIVHGSEDPILPIENGRALADGIRSAELWVMERVGHELPAAHHDAIAERIASFVFS